MVWTGSLSLRLTAACVRVELNLRQLAGNLLVLQARALAAGFRSKWIPGFSSIGLKQSEMASAPSAGLNIFEFVVIFNSNANSPVR